MPAAIGIGLCNATLIALVSNAADRREQGRVQGAAGALESLGRTIGPVWGNALLQRFGEGAAYGTAAALLLGAAALARDARRLSARAPRGRGIGAADTALGAGRSEPELDDPVKRAMVVSSQWN